LVDPLTRRPFSNGVIPGSLLSPQALSLLQYYPKPNLEAGGRYNYQTPVLSGTHQNSLQARVIHSINGRNQLFGNVSFQRTATDADSLFGLPDSKIDSTVESAEECQHRVSI